MSTAMQVAQAGLADVAQNKQLDALRQIATQSTPKSEIRFRQGRGGMQLRYTDGPYVIRTLNQAFGWDWDFVADSEELLLNNGQPFEVKVRGTLTVRLNGQAVTKTQYGCQPIEMLKNGSAPVSIGDAYKGAATDAMKKCASMLGIALDLYDSDYKAEKYAETQTNSDVGVREAYVKQVKLEGAQPQADWCGDLPEGLEGAAGYVIELAKKLKWHEGKVAQCIEANFGTMVMPGKLKDYFDVATKDELRELYRIMNSQGKGKR